MQKIKKRLILKEDINFDVLGVNEKVEFISNDGSYSGKKINAGDLPLKKATRQIVGAVDVDTALSNLGEKILASGGASGILSENTEVFFDASEGVEYIQAAIYNQPRNLNGNTLSFVLPEAVNQQLYTALVFDRFYNGTLKITGASSTNHSEIYDLSDIESLFSIINCQCAVYIENFKFLHQNSLCGVSVENSPAVNVNNCIFYGINNTTSYALRFNSSGGSYRDCIFNYDLPWGGSNIISLNCRSNTEISFTRNVDNSYLGLYGGTTPDSGAGIEIYGKDADTPSEFRLIADTANVNGKNIVRSVNEVFADNSGNVEISTFFAPDFSFAIDTTAKKDYRALVNGFLYARATGGTNGASQRVWINGVEGVPVVHPYNSYGQVFFPIKKGNIFNSYCTAKNIFYPAQGEDVSNGMIELVEA
jgi:hypothetical protein